MPGRIVFPFGYHIKIQLVTDAEMSELEDTGGCHNCQTCSGCKVTGSTVSDGLWLPGSKTISIRKVLGKPRQRYMLSHELQHAQIDWQHHFLNTGVMKP